MKKSKLARKRVKRGIKLLRKNNKDWADDVSAKKLDMGYTGICLLGQMFGCYSIGVSKLGVELAPERYGFDRSGKIGYKRLNRTWKAAIRKERKKAA